TLGRQDGRHQQLDRRLVVEGAAGVRVAFGQGGEDFLGAKADGAGWFHAREIVRAGGTTASGNTPRYTGVVARSIETATSPEGERRVQHTRRSRSGLVVSTLDSRRVH